MNQKINQSKKLATQPKKQQKSSSFNTLLIIFILIIFLGVSFAFGLYMNLYTVENIKSNAFKLMGITEEKKPDTVQPENLNESVNKITTVILDDKTQKTIDPLEKIKLAEKDKAAKVDLLAEEKQRKLEEQKRTAKLARLYSSMKPEEAAPIINNLEDKLIFNIMLKMEEEAVARVLAVMEPQKAARLSEMIAHGIK